METTQKNPRIQKNGFSKKSGEDTTINSLHHLAFENSFQPNIITIANSEHIIAVNNAACKLLGYSDAELLNKSTSAIFDTGTGFKNLLKQRAAEGHSTALLETLKKDGITFSAEITSAVFMDEEGTEKAITTIRDLSQNILQKRIDRNQETLVAEDILVALEKSDARLEENNKWIKYIAQSSYDIMWDWDIASGEIYVGDSIEEVFGYHVKNNTVDFTNFCNSLLSEEKESVVNKLLSTLSTDHKSWKDSFVIKRRDNSQATTTSRASIIRDEEGKAIRLVGATQDVSRVQELEMKLEEQASKLEGQNPVASANVFFDVIWDWNLLTNEVFIGEEFEDMFGYIIKNNRGKIADKADHLHPDDKKDFEKSLQEAIASIDTKWEHTYRFTRADGTIATVFDKASIIRRPGGKAYRMMGTMRDLSRQKELEEKLNYQTAIKTKLISEYLENFKPDFHIPTDALYDYDLLANKLTVSDAFEKEFGFRFPGNEMIIGDWVSHIQPSDKKKLIRNYLRMLSSEEIEWNYTCHLLRADNSVSRLLGTAMVFRTGEGKVYRMAGHLKDSSKTGVLNQQLWQQILLKEKQITDTAKKAKLLEEPDAEKTVQAVVNQLLGACRLYIDMAKSGSEHAQMYLNRSSEYLDIVMEETRKLTERYATANIKNLGLCKTIQIYTRSLMDINPLQISCSFGSFTEHSVNDTFKLNVFRIVQEQLENIQKNATASVVTVQLSQNRKSIKLVISDNCIGVDINKNPEAINIHTVNSHAASYNGRVAFVARQGQGCRLTITFPVNNSMLKRMPGLELTGDKKGILIEKVKKLIVALVHSSDEQLKTNLSNYLSENLQCGYTYLAHLFSELEGITIQQFIISQKIERVKELLVNDGLTLTEIAWELHYSSVAHLSNQFKKVTGFTTSSYKKQHH